MDVKIFKKIKKGKLIEIANLTAKFDQCLMKIKLQKKDLQFSNEFFDILWLLPKFKEMKSLKPKNKLDRIIHQNLPFFEKLTISLSKIDYNKKITITHSDLHKYNFLFKKDKLVGLLDFDNIETVPHIKNIISAIGNNCIKSHKLDKNCLNLFLKEYKKIKTLSKTEEDLIIPGILRDTCISFWWFYMEMEKVPAKKYKFVKKNILTARNLIRYMKI